MAFVLLMQFALPLQAHTQLARDASGQVVVVCTWYGTRTEVIDDPETDPASTAGQLSPASLFSQLLSAAAAADTSWLPVTLYRGVAGYGACSYPPFTTASADPYRIRAPPVVIPA
jgi:hypothetical protein